MNPFRIFLATLCAAACLTAGSARADTFPSHPITIVVPFSPGGAVDALGRMLASKLTTILGQSVIVENRAGAAGSIGINSVARATPDGYTLLYSPNSIAIGPALYRNLPFDTEKDLLPVSQLIASTLILVAHPKTGVGTVQELIARAKAEPGKLNFGSSGVADPLQLGVEMLKTATGIDMIAIPYKGQGPMFQALLADQVDLSIVSLQLALPHIQSGDLKALAVTGGKRSAKLPDVPTMAESGVPGYDLTSWHGVFAPAGTPPDIVEKIHQAVVAASRQPDLRKFVEDAGNEVIANSPAEFKAKFIADIAAFKNVARDAKLPYQD